MRFRVGAALGAAMMLCGCAGIDYVNVTYAKVPVRNFEMKGRDTYRVFDKSADGRMLIMPSLARYTGPNADGGWFGPSNPQAAGTRPEMEAAAQAYLASTGRACRITEMVAPVRGQWEAVYDCSLR